MRWRRAALEGDGDGAGGDDGAAACGRRAAGRAGALEDEDAGRRPDELAAPFAFALVLRLEDAISTAPAAAGYRGMGKRRARPRPLPARLPEARVIKNSAPALPALPPDA
jgi:hypothetical protein